MNGTKIIYEPRGRAYEYSPLAANLYSGCGHGCTYCYAPLALKRSREDFKNSKLRPGQILEDLRKDAESLRGDSRPVLLCFTCDPYQPLDEKYQLTRKAIQILHEYGLTVQILTKGGKRSERDLDLLAAKPNQSIYAATLVFADEVQRKEYEPGAAPTEERIEVLKKAHGLGIPTWVSLEPVFNPEDAYDFIERTYPFVDLFKVGKLNHSPEERDIDWRAFRETAITLLEDYGKKYYIKDDLARY
jgi:DNA repair photolyase